MATNTDTPKYTDAQFIPPAARAAAQRADELMRQQSSSPEEQDATPESNEGDQDNPDLHFSDQKPQDDGAQEGGEEHQEDEQAGEQQASEQQADGSEDEEQEGGRRRRRRRKKGAKTVEELENDLNAMRGRFIDERARNTELQREIDDLKYQLNNVQTDTKQGQTKPKQYVTPEEEAEYGAEFLSVVERKAQQIVDGVKSQYEGEIADLRRQLGHVNQTASQGARDRMLNTLDTDIPEWRELNYDQGFLAWLAEPDEFSGQIRQELLNSAYERNDAYRVAAFFKGFLREADAVPPLEEPSKPTGRAPAPRKRSMDKYAAPGRAKPSAPPRPADDKPVFTRDYVQRFYRTTPKDFQGGKEERDRLEKQIFDAVAEGRVT